MLCLSLLRHRHLSLLLSRHLHSLDLTDPTFIVFSPNTSVGKTLVSAGIADSILSSSGRSTASSFLYLKPLQTGFPLDSDARFVFRKVSDLFRLRRSSDISLLASNHVIKSSIAAREEVLGFGSESESEVLCSYEEVRVGGQETEGLECRLDCKTIFGWKAAISPHLAVEREGMEVDDSTLRRMVAKCLEGRKERKEGVWRVIETAGGVASPGPSGTLQCDLYR